MAKLDYFNQRNIDTLRKLEHIKLDLPKFCNEFFVGIQNNTSPLTRLSYAYDLRIFFDFVCNKLLCTKVPIDLQLSDIERLTAFDIECFLDYLNSYTYGDKELQSGDCAKERKLCAIRALIKYFFKKDLLTKDIGSKISSVKIKQSNIIRLETDEVANLLDNVEYSTYDVSPHQRRYLTQTRLRDLVVLTLFLGTGIRVSELVGLDTTDIDFRNNSFCITRKGGNKSILYFNTEVAKSLNEYCMWRQEYVASRHLDTNALFLSMQGKRISVRAVELLVKKYAKQISPLKKISPHKLRSTFGTQLYRDTQDIYVVAEVLGHKDINTTKKHYAQTSEEIKRAAANTVILRDKQ
ncbi:MAG: tyrosine-type recombinase/integrase [Clostridiales bacterium]|jgi:site-specific recombinase XerD|nr:tyrosine-type recombinase/integrase [Clostridiales bacterium]